MSAAGPPLRGWGRRPAGPLEPPCGPAHQPGARQTVVWDVRSPDTCRPASTWWNLPVIPSIVFVSPFQLDLPTVVLDPGPPLSQDAPSTWSGKVPGFAGHRLPGTPQLWVHTCGVHEACHGGLGLLYSKPFPSLGTSGGNST